MVFSKFKKEGKLAKLVMPQAHLSFSESENGYQNTNRTCDIKW